jgi:hypothetical protein
MINYPIIEDLKASDYQEYYHQKITRFDQITRFCGCDTHVDSSW